MFYKTHVEYKELIATEAQKALWWTLMESWKRNAREDAQEELAFSVWLAKLAMNTHDTSIVHFEG